MRAVDIIAHKRDGGKLSSEQIEFMVSGYVSGKVPDYQMAAWLMAAFLQGLDDQETADLTLSMVKSGRELDLSGIEGPVIDKHSTGGVGDTTTLALAPWVAAAGVRIAKMSGRALGHTGGTLDKLESIPGFRSDLETDAFLRQVSRIGVAIVGQTADLVPADRMIYALRDTTATVGAVPLVASSVMSKKIAAGSGAIILDVKAGSGAFMKTLDQAKQLASLMVAIGWKLGRRTVAVVTDMSQPLGNAVGNALEVKEAISVLQGEGPEDLTELCYVLGSQMLMLGGLARSEREARGVLSALLIEGQALDRLRQLIRAQGGDENVVDRPDELLPKALYVEQLFVQSGGFLQSVDAEKVGRTAMVLGAGRETKESTIDHAAGVIVRAKIGDELTTGQLLAEIHTNQPDRIEEAKAALRDAFQFGSRPVSRPPLVHGIVGEGY